MIATAVSVIMRVLEEERYLAESERRVLAQEYDGEVEVVLVDNPAACATASCARSRSQRR